MKKYVYLYALLAAAVIAGFVLYALVMDMPVRQEVDPLAVNEIVKSVEQDWHDPRRLNDRAFMYSVCVIDGAGRLVWASGRDVADTVQDAVREGYAIMDVSSDGVVVGKALIETHPALPAARIKERFARLAMIATLLLCAISALFLLGLHMAIVRPFQRLERFAHRIASGQFDEPLPMDKSNIFGLFTQSFDVMRASLLEARHRQAEAERAKKELIASLSHDITTPVTSIKLIVELLLAVAPDPALREKLRTIEAKAGQINRLMTDMMHSTLEELGELKVNITGEPSALLQSLFEGADHHGLVRIGSIPGCMVDLDVSRMEQVIGNVIMNSYKYADTNIDVECEIDGDFLRVDVADHGPGVHPDEVELVCAKFYRGENARASQREGEGLGLYVAQLFMQKMGGELEVFNRDSGFTVRLMLRLSK